MAQSLGRLKVAVFVENVIGRQQTFVRAPDDFAVLQDSGGIAKCAPGALRIFVHVADAQRNRTDLFRHIGQYGKVGLDEIGA